MKILIKIIFVLSILMVCGSVLAKDKKKSDSLTYKGAWFEIDYPKNFTVKPSIPSLLSGRGIQQTLASTRIQKLKKTQEQKARMDLSTNGIPMKVKMVLNCVLTRKQLTQKRQLS